MSRDIAPFGLRMPQELKERIESLAKKNRRSLNAEIVVLLESVVNDQTCPDADHIRSIIQEELDKRLK